MARKLLATSSRGFGESKIQDMGPSLLNGDSVITFNVEIITLPGPTRNGVLYPLDEFKRAVADPRIQQMLKTGAFYGESDHPINPEDLTRWCRIEMTNVTHKWNKLWFEGNKLMGECQTWSGNGNMMYHAIKGGELPSFSIRVVGASKPKGEHVELESINLLAIDWVRYPGNPTSFVTSSDVFNVEDAPIYKGFDLHSRVVSKAEAMTNVLKLREDQDVVQLGEGFYQIVDKISKEERRSIYKIRSNSF